MNLIPLTRADALKKWQRFLPHVQAYSTRRNHVVADHANVSQLSTAIRHRLLSEDEIIDDTLQHRSFSSCEKWLQEVCWRRYWKGWLEMHPQVWKHWQRDVAALSQSAPPELLDRAARAAAGESGIACMDAIIRELLDTGYLHNHARMWWASFWIHGLKLPWELGADVFYNHLLDADPASNTLSWRWVAGLQTQGKTYIVRRENIDQFAPHLLTQHPEQSNFLADHAIVPHLPQAYTTPTKHPLPKYPSYLSNNHSHIGLWLHDDDLLPESGPLEKLQPHAIAAFLTNHSSESSLRHTARETILRDAIARAESHFHCPAALIPSADLVVSLIDWAKESRLTEIVSFAPFIGPIHDHLKRISATLAEANITLTMLRRESDAHAFSLSDRGFFPFWEKMRRHLIGLNAYTPCNDDFNH